MGMSMDRSGLKDTGLFCIGSCVYRPKTAEDVERNTKQLLCMSVVQTMILYVYPMPYSLVHLVYNLHSIHSDVRSTWLLWSKAPGCSADPPWARYSEADPTRGKLAWHDISRRTASKHPDALPSSSSAWEESQTWHRFSSRIHRIAISPSQDPSKRPCKRKAHLTAKVRDRAKYGRNAHAAATSAKQKNDTLALQTASDSASDQLSRANLASKPSSPKMRPTSSSRSSKGPN